MKVKFIGAAHEVTGSCTLIEACGQQILVDCGMEQGPDIFENCEIPVNPAEIDAIFVTHAHIDHSGKLPAIVAQGYKGPIFTTEATEKLCSIMLRDSAHIQEFEAEWRNRKAKRAGEGEYVPIYTVKDVEKTMPLFKSFPYDQVLTPFEGIEVSFHDAGHLLGSANILFKITEDGETRTILFSGDLGNPGRPIICPPCKPPHADYLVVESTYGDRTHGPKPDYVTQLADVIQRTLDRGGNVVIPAFAIGRTQELLYLIREIKEQQLIRGHEDFPVWVDSPLAVEATTIYSNEISQYCNPEAAEVIRQGVNPISFPGLKMSITSDDSKFINADPTPKVIISASGMCEAGRIRHHLKHNLWRPECTVLFVGFQTTETLGAKLLGGATKVKLFGESITVQASIERIESFSGHADVKKLTSWVSEVRPKHLFVNHGDDNVCDIFAEKMRTTYNIPSIAPYSGDEYDLLTGECTFKAPIKRLETKKAAAHGRAMDVFERLLHAGQRLRAIIDTYKGASNRDIEKFTQQVEDLCDRWQK